MSSYDVTLPATTNGTISIAGVGGTTVTPGGTQAGDHRCEKSGSGSASPEVRVVATPAGGYAIEAWSVTGFSPPAGSVLSTDPTGVPASVDLTLSANTSVSAPTFAEYHAVTINTVGTGTVEVAAADVASPVRGSTVTVYVKHGATVAFTKTPGAGYQYVSETGATTITAVGNIVVTFEPIAAPPVSDPRLDAGTGTDDYIGHDTVNKYLLLKVPDYEIEGARSARINQATTWDAATSQKNAYVRIGDATSASNISSTDATLGTDLLAGQLEFLDDTRNRGSSSDAGGTFSGALATPPSETATRTQKAYSAASATTSTTGDTGKNINATASIP
ncbi:MAG: hypothetical protein JRI55_22090, partial [Deltaproteobacteria bacterium]|nr:hypothetical protein [Deltaproteobacteria bacterium]